MSTLNERKPSLDELLAQSEQELAQIEGNPLKQNTGGPLPDRSYLELETQTALVIERAILSAEKDLTLKLEKGLWVGAHIVCLPFFYDEYTIQARIHSDLQKKYDKAIITTCSRFTAMGKTGIALVSPITNYIRNYKEYSSEDRKLLESELIDRVFAWLKDDISLDTQPPQRTSHSLETIMTDVEGAERLLQQSGNTEKYMRGEVRFAAVQAIAHSDFLPPLVKYKLLNDLRALNDEEVFDIGTFLLWEIRKSSVHHNKLLYYMLLLFKRLSGSLTLTNTMQ